jgi:hypothetical protein
VIKPTGVFACCAALARAKISAYDPFFGGALTGAGTADFKGTVAGLTPFFVAWGWVAPETNTGLLTVFSFLIVGCAFG